MWDTRRDRLSLPVPAGGINRPQLEPIAQGFKFRTLLNEATRQTEKGASCNAPSQSFNLANSGHQTPPPRIPHKLATSTARLCPDVQPVLGRWRRRE